MERILIKLSGEALANKSKSLAIDYKLVQKIAHQIKRMKKNKKEIGIVIGGGNFWRGTSAEKNGIPRNRADYIGMLATVMNGLAVQSVFEKYGIKTRVMSAINVDNRVAEGYKSEKAIEALKHGEIVIFVGGTGRPFFTTDTAATLVASEIGAHTILMGKNGVKGVYDSDPKINPNAIKYNKITYDELLIKGLTVMDATAASMAKENNIKLIVFDINENDAILKASNQNIEHTKVEK